ncbi:MAG: radical SAM family heme chaperone HemW [Tannerellaceae bacterium]|nr:radical SAM family heme chaperone HemW [Tannerellaceae bacterium]
MAGLYIHIPFCAKRCIYCDFFSNTDMSYKERFLDAVIREMELRKKFLPESTLQTIYLGGGTPSQLSPGDLKQLLNAVYTHFEVSDEAELTLEVNPDDLTENFVEGLTKLPFNRVSMGIQSFQEKDLKFLNRRHTSGQAMEAVTRLQKSGLSNISIDLIYGLPGQTFIEWEENIQQALSLDVPHISAYHLMYEEGTVLYQLKEKGMIRHIEEEQSLKAFNHLINRLTDAGFIHYEISNFAKPGFISRHNSSYWQSIPYLGLGPSAHSYNGRQRDWNVASLSSYLEGIEKGVPQTEGEILDTVTAYNDAIITGLRTMWGVNLSRIAALYGEKLAGYCRKEAQPFLNNKLLTLQKDTLTLTREGLFISDTIMSGLLYVP